MTTAVVMTHHPEGPDMLITLSRLFGGAQRAIHALDLSDIVASAQEERKRALLAAEKWDRVEREYRNLAWEDMLGPPANESGEG